MIHFIVLHRLFGLGQHARFRAFDQFKAGQVVLGIVNHRADDAVAVIARFDAVDLAVELVLVGAKSASSSRPASATYCGTTRP